MFKDGQAEHFCPFYAYKERTSGADVVFMPYNYIADERIRDTLKLDFENSVIIFDEAHNISDCFE